MVTHIVGGAIGIAVLVLGIVKAAKMGPWAVVGVSVYGASLICLYAVSSVYHGLRSNMGKKVMQVIDHCTIYFLIAGTYTPILFIAIRPVSPVMAWVLFGIEWGCAALAAALTAIDLKKYNVFSMVCYLCMGWAVIFCMKTVMEVISLAGFMWLLAGGIAYTVGAVLYGLGKKRAYMHCIFHIFVILGSVFQAVSILVYVIN